MKKNFIWLNSGRDCRWENVIDATLFHILPTFVEHSSDVLREINETQQNTSWTVDNSKKVFLKIELAKGFEKVSENATTQEEKSHYMMLRNEIDQREGDGLSVKEMIEFMNPYKELWPIVATELKNEIQIDYVVPAIIDLYVPSLKRIMTENILKKLITLAKDFFRDPIDPQKLVKAYENCLVNVENARRESEKRKVKTDL